MLILACLDILYLRTIKAIPSLNATEMDAVSLNTLEETLLMLLIDYGQAISVTHLGMSLMLNSSMLRLVLEKQPNLYS